MINMALVALGDFTQYSKKEGGWETILLQSPTSMDSNDTLDITAILYGRTVVNIKAWDTTTGDTSTATYNNTTDVITVDASGGTTDHVYVIRVDLLRM